MFVQEHDGSADPAVLQSLLTHTGQLQETHGQYTTNQAKSPPVTSCTHLLKDPEQLLPDPESRQ